MSHDKLSPSGFKANALCPGRYRANKGLPDTSSVYAEEGTTAHELLEFLQLGKVSPEGLKSYCGENGVCIDEEGVNAVINTYEFIQDFINTLPDEKPVVLVEQKVNPELYYEDEPVARGTADIIIYSYALNTIYVLDYKHGKGIVVEPDHNYQLMLYALGAYYKLYGKLFFLMPVRQLNASNVVMGILQPRAFHVDGPYRFSKPVETHVLLNDWQPFFQRVVNISLSETGRLVAGEEQCKWCKAKATCPELSNQALQRAQVVFSPINTNTGEEIRQNAIVEPETLTDTQLVMILENKDLIVGWLNAVKEYAENKLLKNEYISGLKLVSGRSNRAWESKNDKAIISTLKAIGLKEAEVTDIKLKSPSQIEHSIKRKVSNEDWAIIESLFVKGAGKPTVVSSKDKRPGINKSPQEVFKPIGKENGNVQ